MHIPRILTRRDLVLVLLPLALCHLCLAQENRFPLPGTEAHPVSGIVQLLAVAPGAGQTKQECAATGFLVNDDGHVLTNAHVVEDARRCLASTPEAKIVAKFDPGDPTVAPAIACDVVAVDEDHDLAILKTELHPPTHLRGVYLRLSPDPVLNGTRIAVTGHPAFAWQPQTRKGRVLARVETALNEKSVRRTEVLVLSIALQRGASGSPVQLPSGAVVGIVERQRPSQPSQTLAVPIDYAIKLLDLHGIAWRGPRPPRD